MKERTRSEVWLILSRAFDDIVRGVENSVRDLKVTTGHHHSAAFLFWAYAQFSAKDVVVVISFSVQSKDGRTEVWGDIAKENGVVLKDLCRSSVSAVADHDEEVIACANEVAAQWRSCVEVAATELASTAGT